MHNSSPQKTDRFLKFLIAVLIVTAVFLSGYIWNRRNATLQQASVLEASLADRFSGEVKEKRAPRLRFTRITSDESFFAKLNPDNETVLYYNPVNGEVKTVKVDGSGSSRIVTGLPPLLSRISWSKNGKSIFGSSGDNVVYAEFESGRSKQFPLNIKKPALSPYEDRVAYVYFDNNSGEGSISIADLKIESFKNILQTRSPNWGLGWLNKEKLYLIKGGYSSPDLSSLFSLDTTNGKLNSLIDSKKDLAFKISPSGNMILYSYFDVYKDSYISHVKELASGRQNQLKTTVNASKCTWGAILPDKIYCAKADSGGDSFYKINLKTGDAEKIFIPDEEISATELILTSDEKYLIFKNLNNNRIYSLLLK